MTDKFIVMVSYQRYRAIWFSVILLLLSVCSDLKAGPAVKLMNASWQSPDFILEDMQGLKHQLSAYAGKTVIVNFWATWCKPCRSEIPAMNRAWSSLDNTDVVMLAVNVGDEPVAIEAFKKQYPIAFTVLMDRNGAVSQSWQVAGFPTTFIVNAQGQVVFRAVGGREWDGEDMLDSIRSIAAN